MRARIVLGNFYLCLGYGSGSRTLSLRVDIRCLFLSLLES